MRELPGLSMISLRPGGSGWVVEAEPIRHSTMDDPDHDIFVWEMGKRQFS